jgi:branched-chain amino acid transport system ATP-binding protein
VNPTIPLLQTRGLTKEFMGFRAVGEVDLSIGEGTIHALVGPNGAGKTTLFNLLTGFLTPTAGTILFRGEDITGKAPEQIAFLGIARSFQITSLFDQLTGLEHLELALTSPTGPGMRFWRSDQRMGQFRVRSFELMDQVGLAHLADKPAGSLAYGQKRALELALALALEPSLRCSTSQQPAWVWRTWTARSPWSNRGPQPVDRGDVDDPAPPTLVHVGKGALDDAEGRLEHDPQDQ